MSYSITSKTIFLNGSIFVFDQISSSFGPKRLSNLRSEMTNLNLFLSYALLECLEDSPKFLRKALT